MTEPANDTSLLNHPARDLRTIQPLRWLTEPDFIHFVARPRHWEITRPTVVCLPGYQFRHCLGQFWSAQPGRLELWPGLGWDGASGPAADTPDTWIASAVHDVSCEQCDGAPVLPGYLTRHSLYVRILWHQRPRPAPRHGLGRLLDLGREAWCLVRCALDWIGLVAANWWVAAKAAERRRT